MNAIRRLWVEVVIHNHFVGVTHVVGNSMIVGIRIFSIGEDLGFGGGQSHGFVRWLLK